MAGGSVETTSNRIGARLGYDNRAASRGGVYRSIHEPMNTRPSQAKLIHAALERKRGCWVSLLHLHHVSGAFAVHSRVAELRRRGYSIENRTERAEDGACESWYRLIGN